MSVPSVDALKATPSFRQALKAHGPVTILVENADRRRLSVDLTRDGVSAWLVRIRSGERALMDSGMAGIPLDEDSLIALVINGFRLLDVLEDAARQAS